MAAISKKLAALSTAKTREFRGHRSKVHTVGWSCDGQRLASGSVDHSARVFTNVERTTRKDSLELRGHTDSVDQLCWDPTQPHCLATASVDKTVRIWDARSGKCSSVVALSGENINICWSPDGHHIAVGNKEEVLTIIDSRKFLVERTQSFPEEVNEISWNKRGDLFFLTTGAGTIYVLDYPSLKLLHTVKAHTANCYCIEFDPKGRYFATGSADALVSLWDIQEFACIRTFSKLSWPVRTLGFSYDGDLIASASEDLFIDISIVETGESLHQVACSAAINSLAWHPSQYLLAFAGDELDRDRREEGNLRVFGFHDDK